MFDLSCCSCAGVIGAVRRAVPGIYVRNVIIGENLVEDKHNSVFMKMRDQVCIIKPFQLHFS